MTTSSKPDKRQPPREPESSPSEDFYSIVAYVSKSDLLEIVLGSVRSIERAVLCIPQEDHKLEDVKKARLHIFLKD